MASPEPDADSTLDMEAAGARNKMLRIWIVVLVAVLVALIATFVMVTTGQMRIFDMQVERNQPTGASYSP